MQMDNEKSITKLDSYIGKKIQVIAYGASYVGTLQKVDYEKGFVLLTDGKNVVTLDIERIESFSGIED